MSEDKWRAWQQERGMGRDQPSTPGTLFYVQFSAADDFLKTSGIINTPWYSVRQAKTSSAEVYDFQCRASGHNVV